MFNSYSKLENRNKNVLNINRNTNSSDLGMELKKIVVEEPKLEEVKVEESK